MRALLPSTVCASELKALSTAALGRVREQRALGSGRLARRRARASSSAPDGRRLRIRRTSVNTTSESPSMVRKSAPAPAGGVAPPSPRSSRAHRGRRGGFGAGFGGAARRASSSASMASMSLWLLAAGGGAGAAALPADGAAATGGGAGLAAAASAVWQSCWRRHRQ